MAGLCYPLPPQPTLYSSSLVTMCGFCCHFSCQPGCSQAARGAKDSTLSPAMTLTLTQAHLSLESAVRHASGSCEFLPGRSTSCSRVSGSHRVSCTVMYSKRLCEKSTSEGNLACQCWQQVYLYSSQPGLSRSGLQGSHSTFTSSRGVLSLSPTPPTNREASAGSPRFHHSLACGLIVAF